MYNSKKRKIKRKHKKNCKKKKMFETRQEAYKFLNNFKEDKYMKIYKCPFCKKWHLTSNNSKIYNLFEKLKVKDEKR